MAGNVPARLQVFANGQDWAIDPFVCPAADEHRRDAVIQDEGLHPRCQDYNVFRGRRTCPYWYGTVSDQNATHRLDGSDLWNGAMTKGVTSAKCGVLCMAQRRNRPPGV